MSSLADLKEVMQSRVTIEKFKDENGNPIEVVIKPLTYNKARKIIENYGIFAEELIFNKIDIEKLDEVEYVRNFGMEKFDEAMSYVIAVALDSEDAIEMIHIDMPWHNKLEIFVEILELSLPEDKKKAQETMEKVAQMMLTPLLKVLNK